MTGITWPGKAGKAVLGPPVLQGNNYNATKAVQGVCCRAQKGQAEKRKHSQQDSSSTAAMSEGGSGPSEIGSPPAMPSQELNPFPARVYAAFCIPVCRDKF